MTQTSTRPMRGRDRELGVLTDLWRGSVTEGRGGVCLVEGPAGIGKSRLVTAAVEAASAAGVRVAAGRAEEIGSGGPLAPLLLALREAVPPLATTEDSGVPGIELDQRLALLDAMTATLQRAAAEGPLLMAVDDLQWADDATLFALRHLPRRTAPNGVAWLLARRPHPARPALEALAERLVSEGAVQLRVGPLPEQVLEAVVTDVLEAGLSSDVADLVGEARGSPFLAVSLAEALLDTRGLRVDEGRASLAGTELPPPFIRAVGQKLRSLAPESLRLLQVASVLGRAFDPQDASRLLGWSVTERLAEWEELTRAHLLVADGTLLAFQHDLLRRAVYDDLPPAVRIALHRDAARGLSASGRSLLDVVPHLLASAAPGDDEAVDQLLGAAGRLVRVSPTEAADLGQRALELTPLDSARRLERIVAVVPLLAFADRRTSAETYAVEVARAVRSGSGTGVDEAVVGLALAGMRWLAGDFVAALAATGDALATPDLPAALRVQLIGVHVQVATSLRAADASLAARIEEMVRLSSEAVEPRSTALCEAALAQAAIVTGDGPTALRHIGAAMACWPELEPSVRGQRIVHVMALSFLDRFAEADGEIAVGLTESAELGLTFTIPIWHQLRAQALIYEGDVLGAQAEVETAAALSDELGRHEGDIDTLGLRAHCAFLQGDRPTARAHADAALQTYLAGIGGDWSRTGAGRAGLVMGLLGEDAAASTILGPCYESLHGLVRGFNSLAALEIVPLLRLARAAGDEARVAAMCAIAEEMRRRNPASDSAAAAHEHALGLTHDDPAALRRAADLWARHPRLRGPLAWALEDLAMTGLGDGAHDTRQHAVESLDRARQLFTDLGWVAPALETQRILRQWGRRSRSWIHRPAQTVTGWAALTAAELKVAELAALGHTNKAIAEELFLSPHTVNTHLGKIFRKLDVTSRIQLARLAADRRSADGAADQSH